MNHLPSLFWGLKNPQEFIRGLQHAVNQISIQDGIYAGDNLFTYGRNLSFLGDQKFMNSFRKHAQDRVEEAILWRIAVVAWGVLHGLNLEGDFVECACYKGTTVRIICDYVDFGNYKDRKYYLYDLFEHDPNMPHHSLPEHGSHLYEYVKNRFSDLSNVIVTKGKVPEILYEISPQKIAFMHIDLNNAHAEIGALEVLFDRMVPGSVLILDDYGWLGYRAQKEAEDPWFEKRGYKVLEIPTGQGIVIKR